MNEVKLSAHPARGGTGHARRPHAAQALTLRAGRVPVEKGADAMIKIGDRFKDKTTGKIYIMRMEIDNDTICLEGENGLGRRLTGKAILTRTCEKLEQMTS